MQIHIFYSNDVWAMISNIVIVITPIQRLEDMNLYKKNHIIGLNIYFHITVNQGRNHMGAKSDGCSMCPTIWNASELMENIDEMCSDTTDSSLRIMNK